MILLDTDTFSIAQHPDSPEALILRRRLVMLPKDVMVGATIISYEEQTRGWLAFFAKATTKPQQLNAYFRLFKHLRDWRSANVIPFDDNAANVLDYLHSLHLKIGNYDLKIASIALSRNATLVTRNIRHFGQIPGLHVEDWTKP